MYLNFVSMKNSSWMTDKPISKKTQYQNLIKVKYKAFSAHSEKVWGFLQND